MCNITLHCTVCRCLYFQIIMADNEVVSKRYFCGHCSKELSKTRFFQHRRLFYNRKTKEWSQQRFFESRLGENFNFSDNEDDSTSN
jgi:hypothetical protein